MKQSTYLKVPLARVGVLIGPKGRAKKRIETVFSVSLTIDSEAGSVEISLNPEAKDVSALFTVRNIVRAIGRGFNPRKAERLADEESALIIIDLIDYVGRSKNALGRVKGRIIGRYGRSRELLEELSETMISVYGHTVAIIGTVDSLNVAREAVLMLVKGAFHKTVWNFLYAYRRKAKKKRAEIWEELQEPREEPQEPKAELR